MTASSTNNPVPPESRQLLVAFRDEKSAETRSALFEKYKAREIERIGPTPLYVIELPEGSDLKAVEKEMSAVAGVKSVEPNLQLRIMKSK